VRPTIHHARPAEANEEIVVKVSFKIEKHGGLINTARWVVTVRRDSLLNNKTTTHEFRTEEAAKAFIASMNE
jgi:hypothetical protein